MRTTRPLLRTLMCSAFVSVLMAACGGAGRPTAPGDSGGGPPSGGGSDTPPTAPSAPAVTPVGRVLGQAVAATIGPAGGTLVSGDGQATLVVPPGALAADTAITMVPVTSEAPGGIAAWRFGPAGLSFASPATHAVDEVTADAPGDDGAVAASLTMTVPTVDYRYQYGFKEPGFESLSELASRRAALDFYDADGVGYRPALTLNALADGRLQVPAGTLLAYLDVRGQRVESRYDGTTGQTTVSRFTIEQPVSAGPDCSRVPTGVMLRHPITGAPLGELPGTFEGQRLPGPDEVWAGDTTLEKVQLVFEGQSISGSLRAQWKFSRRRP